MKHLVFGTAKNGWNVVVSNHRGLGGVSITVSTKDKTIVCKMSTFDLILDIIHLDRGERENRFQQSLFSD